MQKIVHAKTQDTTAMQAYVNVLLSCKMIAIKVKLVMRINARVRALLSLVPKMNAFAVLSCKYEY